MMKIVHVVEATATGTLSMIQLLANSQVKAGHEVYLIASIRPETPADFRKSFDSKIVIEVLDLAPDIFALIKVFRLRSRVGSIKPQVIFLHSTFAGVLGRIASVFSKARVIYIPHCISFMRLDVSFVTRLSYMFIENLLSLKSSTIVACSRSEYKLIKRVLPVAKCDVIENAIDDSFWASSSQARAKRRIQVVTVGHIRAQKDPAQFAEVVRLLNQRVSDLDVVWIGDGDSDSKSALKDAGVKVTGWLPRTEVRELLKQSAVYLSTSRWEGLPVAPIEAMLCGCVPVLRECTGNTDITRSFLGSKKFVEPHEAASEITALIEAGDADFDDLSKGLSDLAKSRFGRERYIHQFSALLPSHS